MTQRRIRLTRLALLRERQHEEAALALRSAKCALEQSVRHVETHAAQARQAMADQRYALCNEDHHAWMLSCVAYELVFLEASLRQAEHLSLQALYTTAEKAELNARREMRQMEALLEAVRAEHAANNARTEQRLLDETAQIMKRRFRVRPTDVANVL